jgi:hypothetical protein
MIEGVGRQLATALPRRLEEFEWKPAKRNEFN